MTTEAITIERARARHGRGRRPGAAAVYRWELRKLVAQKRTFIGIGAAIAVPLIFVVAMAADSTGGPEGVPFAEYVRETGLAVPLVCLFFGPIWLLPLITALVAGDIVAAEDQNGSGAGIAHRRRLNTPRSAADGNDRSARRRRGRENICEPKQPP